MSVTEYKKYNSCVSKYNKLYNKIKIEFNKYEIEHENELVIIQESIDEINKVKPVLKYILEKESKKLREMGVDSSVSDYPEESIDYRNFNLKKDYNLICQERLSLEEPISQDASPFDYNARKKILLDRDIVGGMLELLIDYCGDKIMDNIYAYRLERKTKKLQEKQRMINERILADLTQLKSLKKSLNNISDIYKKIKDALTDIMENNIREIEDRYNNNFSEIPPNILLMMHSSSKIMKEISEKRIIPKGFSAVNAKEVVECENQLLELHTKLDDNLYTYDKELYKR